MRDQPSGQLRILSVSECWQEGTAARYVAPPARLRVAVFSGFGLRGRSYIMLTTSPVNMTDYAWLGTAVLVPPASIISAPPRPASSVIYEYNFGSRDAASTGEQIAFAIVLRDGSPRAARAVWVTSGNLHYIDLNTLVLALAHLAHFMPELDSRFRQIAGKLDATKGSFALRRFQGFR